MLLFYSEVCMLFVFIAGGSGIGKSEISARLAKKLQENGYKTAEVRMDNYYKNRPEGKSKEDYNRETNFDEPDALQLDRFHRDLVKLNEGKEIEQPFYDMSTQQATETLSIDPAGKDVIIVEGLYAIHEAQKIRGMNQFKIYVEPMNYFDPIQRRIERDVSGDRGSRTRDSILYSEFKSVGPGFFSYISPQANRADLRLNNCKGKFLDDLVIKAYDALKNKLPIKEIFVSNEKVPVTDIECVTTGLSYTLV